MIVLAAVLTVAVGIQAQVAPAPQTPAPVPGQVPAPAPAPGAPGAPAAPAPQAPGIQPAVPVPVTPALPLNPRALTGESGVIFTSVRPERLVDFETVMTYLQEALETTTDATTRRQWQGLRILKQTEPGPNSSIVYMFVIDPVVAGADYSLGPVLSAAYPDKIQEIWKLYTGSIIQQSVSNLTAFVPPALPPAAAPTPAAAPPAGRGAAPAGQTITPGGRQ